jgi:hypothetical protein
MNQERIKEREVEYNIRELKQAYKRQHKRLSTVLQSLPTFPGDAAVISMWTTGNNF